MFKFFFCALLFSTSCIQSSFPDPYSQSLFRNQSNSPDSIVSTQPPSPVTKEQTRLLSGLEDRVTERQQQQTVGLVVPQEDAINTENMYCKATIYFLGYLTVIGGVGGIITLITHAT